MRVKRYVAETLQDAMLKVKVDMGKDAVILHTRKFREGGFFGFFGKQMFEVTAAIEDAPAQVSQKAPRQEKPVNKNLDTPPAKSTVNNDSSIQESIVGTDSMIAAASDTQTDLHEEIQEMKSLLSEMINQMDVEEEVKALPKGFQKYHQMLMENEVDEKLAKKILREILKKLPKEETADNDAIRACLEQQILKLLKKPKPLYFKRQGLKQQAVALVGPTGVGKTTTIAKLAATFAIVDKKNVALITADTYRVAAVEQLKTYGEIIGIPVDVVFTPQELQEAIARHTDKDLILIDTAGRSHKNTEQMVELKSLLEVAEPSEIFLVLSASTRYKDMIEIVNRYSDIAINRLIFTKLDETSSYGAILNVISKTQKYLSYITVGQNVPDDIEVADPAKIVNMIMGEKAHA
ncbi:MAG TPA: flagellar biosynthesis protein FlhF [Desulfobacteria bacterium]|nr:flagellar biosynthesis protein FlhF [Desulfobacteria bacterium]